MHYDIIVDFKGFKWLIQTTDFCPVGSKIGIKIDPDGIHIMKKSKYSGMFGDYSSYSAEYDENERCGVCSLKNSRRICEMRTKFLAIPYVVWMAIFVVAPIILVVIYAFTTADGGFTLGNFSSMMSYLSVFGRSFYLALISSVICILIGYPIALQFSLNRAPVSSAL